MPTRITFSDGRKIEFIYDATGRKWRKTAIPIAANVPPTYRDYIGEAEYLNGVQDIIHFTEGYAQRDITTDGDGVWNGWVYKYTLKDHLGNTRVTYSDKNKDGVVTTADIEQVNHYYPFGLNMEGPWNGADGAFKYGFNGKEWNDDFGIGLNDYGARFYDPAAARWNAVDPLADFYRSTSNYSYVENNPINYMDIEGRYKFPAIYHSRYSKLTAYLRQNVLNDIIRSPLILAGFLKHSGGNLTLQEVRKAVDWGSGPTIEIEDMPEGRNGRYEVKSNTIFISTALANQLENANESVLHTNAALTSLYKTLLHETVHYGDYLDGIRQDGGEPGDEFDNDIYYTGYKYNSFLRKNVYSLNTDFANGQGINTIEKVQSWYKWARNGGMDLYQLMQLIPTVPGQPSRKVVPVIPLPIIPLNPIVPPRA